MCFYFLIFVIKLSIWQNTFDVIFVVPVSAGRIVILVVMLVSVILFILDTNVPSSLLLLILALLVYCFRNNPIINNPICEYR